MIYAAVDTETTGLSPDVDEIIEIAVVLFEKTGMILEEYHSYCSPHTPIPSAATAVNGITMDMVIGYDSYDDQRPKILDVIKKSNTIIGHNLISFDLPMMKIKTDNDRVYDTMLECQKRYPRRKHNLENMCKAHKIKWDKTLAHGALYDAKRSMYLFLALEFGSNLQVSFMDDAVTKVEKKPLVSFAAMISEAFDPTASKKEEEKPSGESKSIGDDSNFPRLINGCLIIPFNSPEKYHWWNKGQKVLNTLKELNASNETIDRYVQKDFA